MIWRKRRGDCVDLTGITAEEKKKTSLVSYRFLDKKRWNKGK